MTTRFRKLVSLTNATGIAAFLDFKISNRYHSANKIYIEILVRVFRSSYLYCQN